MYVCSSKHTELLIQKLVHKPWLVLYQLFDANISITSTYKRNQDFLNFIRSQLTK